MADGKHPVLLTRAVKGSPESPFTFEGGIAEFRQCTRRIIPDEQSAELIESVRGLIEVKDRATVVRATAARTSAQSKRVVRLARRAREGDTLPGVELELNSNKLVLTMEERSDSIWVLDDVEP
jgi:hypothetical protein